MAAATAAPRELGEALQRRGGDRGGGGAGAHQELWRSTAALVLDVAQARLAERGGRWRWSWTGLAAGSGGDLDAPARRSPPGAGARTARRHQFGGDGRGGMQRSMHAAGCYTVDPRRRRYHGWMPYHLHDVELDIGKLKGLQVFLSHDNRLEYFAIVEKDSGGDAQSPTQIKLTELQVDLLLKVHAHVHK